MDHNSVRKINHKPYRKEVRILENGVYLDPT